MQSPLTPLSSPPSLHQSTSHLRPLPHTSSPHLESPSTPYQTSTSDRPSTQLDHDPTSTPEHFTRSALLDTIHRYWDLGFTSFGGPGVHVIILRKRFVNNFKWIDPKTFLDLFALGNALPGPGSTQLAFSIAVVHHGVLCGLLAFFLWSIPGAVGMACLAVGVSRIPSTLPEAVLALLSGLNAAAVGLIALAAVQLATGAATDRLTMGLVWLSASFGISYHAPWMYPTLIAAGGCVAVIWDFRRVWMRLLRRGQRQSGEQGEVEEVEMAAARRPNTPTSTLPNGRSLRQGEVNETTQTTRRRRQGQEGDVEATPDGPTSSPLTVVSVKVAVALLVGFVVLLTVPLATRAGLKNAGRDVPRSLDFFCNMIIAGTIIFGGGPVVIPLLRDYVVVEGWVSSRDFLLVFAILQAFPGPNFNFAVALGVLALSSSSQPHLAPLGAFLGYIGIFLPGILLKLALLPLYSSWRDKSLARSVIRGLNATASGLVFTAVWQLFLVGYIYQSASGTQTGTVSGPLTADPFWAVVASGSFVATRSFASPPWLSVLGGGVAGLCWWAATR